MNIPQAPTTEAGLRILLLGDTIQLVVEQLASLSDDLSKGGLIGPNETAVIAKILALAPVIETYWSTDTVRPIDVTEITRIQFQRIKDRHDAINRSLQAIEELIPVMHNAPTRTGIEQFRRTMSPIAFPSKGSDQVLPRMLSAQTHGRQPHGSHPGKKP